MSSPFLVSTPVVVFAEIGDKTQIATVVLGAQDQALVPVVPGTTFGMMIANVPVVVLGNAMAHRIPLRRVHIAAAIMFAALGVCALLGPHAGG